jgi:hypothetical protein
MLAKIQAQFGHLNYRGIRITMKRGFATLYFALAPMLIALALTGFDATTGGASAQNAPAPWPAAPAQGAAAAAPWPSAPAQGAQHGTQPVAQQPGAPWPSAGAPAGAGAGAGGWPQATPMRPPGSVDCNAFANISENAHKKAEAVQAAMKAKADRKLICTLMTTFLAAEGSALKFLVDNKTACGVPEQAIANSKTNHAKSTQFREMACSENAPHQKTPTLSDAIKTPTVDSAANTKTGRGTLDTLMGNPLSR